MELGLCIFKHREPARELGIEPEKGCFIFDRAVKSLRRSSRVTLVFAIRQRVIVFILSMLLESNSTQLIKGRRLDSLIMLPMLQKYVATFYISCGW